MTPGSKRFSCRQAKQRVVTKVFMLYKVYHVNRQPATKKSCGAAGKSGFKDLRKEEANSETGTRKNGVSELNPVI